MSYDTIFLKQRFTVFLSQNLIYMRDLSQSECKLMHGSQVEAMKDKFTTICNL